MNRADTETLASLAFIAAVAMLCVGNWIGGGIAMLLAAILIYGAPIP